MKTTKRFILLTMLLMGAISLSASDNIIVEGSFASIKAVKKFNIEIDWTVLHVNGLSPAEWINFRNNEQPQYDAVREFEEELKPRWMDMVVACNEKLNKKQIFLLPNAREQEYRVVVSPHEIDRKGNLEGFVTIMNGNDEVIVKFVITGKGGHFGTMGNLWGDGFKSAGKNLAKILEKQLYK